jgi:hypothetical protein
MIKKVIKTVLLILVVLIIAAFGYFFIGNAKQVDSITWGIDFSQMQAEALKLDWRQTFTALLDDLRVRNIKLHTQWDFVEGKKDDFYFNDIDWQLQEAQKRNANIIYVVGIKTGRWPECHMPLWAESLTKDQREKEALEYVREVVLRYKDNKTISYWQAENEPLLSFGECPSSFYDGGEFLKKEVELIKSLDPSRQVIVSDSGELSAWLKAGQIGDILGTTMYRRAWVNISSFGLPISNPGFYGTYPIPPVFYERKAGIINKLFGKKVICVELQAEPWAPKPFYDVSLEEQAKTMDLTQFRKNVEYAKETGLDTFYLWGAEWWYWMKDKQNQSEIWNEAKKLF